MSQPPSQPVIEAKGLNLVFQTADGPVHALKDVNLTIGKGEFVSFIGPCHFIQAGWTKSPVAYLPG